MSELISSAANPLVKRVRALADRRTRRQEGVFVAEGIQPVWRAVELGWHVDTFVIAPGRLPERASAMIAEQESAGTRVARLTDELFTRISDREGPSGLLAIIAAQPVSLSQFDVPADGVVAVLDRIANPGNLGTIIRTVDAAGGAGVVLLGESTDPFAPAAIKASMGSVFALPVVPAPNLRELLPWARSQDLHLVATSGRASVDHWDAQYRRPVGLLLGSEREGLPGELLERADIAVRIPMAGSAESLNLAVAAGVMVYEIQRKAL